MKPDDVIMTLRDRDCSRLVPMVMDKLKGNPGIGGGLPAEGNA